MPAPAAPEREPHYLCEMMNLLGLEPGGGAIPRLSPSYVAALRHCNSCKSKQACRDWLGKISPWVAFAPRFCPNAEIFFELQVDEPSAWTDNSRSKGPPSRWR